LRQRGIGAAAHDPMWQLGSAPPGGRALLDHLRGLGFDDQVMLDAGVVVPRTTTGDLRDRWINRLMFPIHDLEQQVIGFTGRDMSDGSNDRIPKWLNSGTTDLFAKSKVLYGLGPQLAQSIPDGATVQVAVVEGPADVIATHAAYAGLQAEGTFTIAAAPCGTAFTADQFGVLASTLGQQEAKLLVAFDSDKAGAKAFDRAYEMLRTWPGPTAGLSALPTKDIADLVGRDGIESALLTLLAAERPLPLLAIEHRLGQMTAQGFDPAIPEHAAAAYTALSEFVFQSADTKHSMLAVDLISEQLRLPVNQVVDGVTTAYEQKHQLFEQDQPGPAPPVKVAASAFAIGATGVQNPAGPVQHDAETPVRVAARASR
ncbi:MAG: toprim domain-containing protein, partial [Catenulispora sp.]|nr:toprim domain-containing protein [Catenulispora sp.]